MEFQGSSKVLQRFSGGFRSVPLIFIEFPGVPGMFRNLREIPGCSSVFHGIPETFQWFRERSRTLMEYQGHSRKFHGSFMGLQGFPAEFQECYRGNQERSMMLQDVSASSSGYQGVTITRASYGVSGVFQMCSGGFQGSCTGLLERSRVFQCVSGGFRSVPQERSRQFQGCSG